MALLARGSTGTFIDRMVGSLRLKPVLTVVGRATGQPRKVTVNVLDLDGKRYLVSPRGETQWVRNLRAAGRAELRTRRGTEQVTVREVPDDAKPDIIAAYRARWGRETKALWEQLPDPADHPTFEISS